MSSWADYRQQAKELTEGCRELVGDVLVKHVSGILEEMHKLVKEQNTLRQQLAAANEENEHVRQANLDVMMHFEDMKAAKQKAAARVAELESLLGRAWSSHCLEAVDWVDQAKDILARSDSAPWLLRTQAEAVEEAARLMEAAGNAFDAKFAASDYAQRLRQQANEAERAGGAQ